MSTYSILLIRTQTVYQYSTNES